MLPIGVIVASPDRKWRETVSRGLDRLDDRIKVTTRGPSSLQGISSGGDRAEVPGKAHLLVLDVRDEATAEELAGIDRELPGSTIIAVVDDQEARETLVGLYTSGVNVCLPRGKTPTETAEIVRLAIGFFLDIASLPEASRM